MDKNAVETMQRALERIRGAGRDVPELELLGAKLGRAMRAPGHVRRADRGTRGSHGGLRLMREVLRRQAAVRVARDLDVLVGNLRDQARNALEASGARAAT